MKIKVRPHDSVRELNKSAEEFLKSLNLNIARWQKPQECGFSESCTFTIYGMDASAEQWISNTEWVWRFEAIDGTERFYLCDKIIAARVIDYDDRRLGRFLARLPRDLAYLSLANLAFSKLPKEVYALSKLVGLNLRECELLSDIDNLSKLQKLSILNLSECKCLSDLSILSLNKLYSLNLTGCEKITNLHFLSSLLEIRFLSLSGLHSIVKLDALNGLKNLLHINLSDCSMLSDISGLKNSEKISTLDLRDCKSLTKLDSLKKLKNLKNLFLSGCSSISDLKPISKLISIKNLNLSGCKSLVDLSPISALLNIEILNLEWGLEYGYPAANHWLTNLSPLSGLLNIKKLNLNWLFKIKDYSPLSGLINLTELSLNGSPISDLSFLANLRNLTNLSLFACSNISSLSPLSNMARLKYLYFNSLRIKSIEPLRKIITIRKIEKFNPSEVAELLAHTACLRCDRPFILKNSKSWIHEAIAWQEGSQSMQLRFATTLGEAFSLLGESPIEPAYEDFINNRPDFTSSPWKAWFGGTVKESGFDLYRQRVERISVASMLPGAIGGACATLPHDENAEWSRHWLANLEKARLSDAQALLNVAPEICLAHARLGEIEALGRWLVRFTDPSDPAALDPVHEALAGFQLAKGNLPAAENHIFAIQSPKLRDPVIADLVTALSESDAEGASAKLFLIDSPAIRVESAKRLAAKPDASETTLHRLAVAMGDSPGALAELITAIPDPSNKTFLETLSGKLQPARSATFRKIAEGLQREADRLLATAVQN
jgi:hypothetical protein